MKLPIGKVAKILGLSAKTIRYYEDIGLVPATAREGAGWFSKGRRVYEEREVDRLRFVQDARRLDFSIGEIRKLLEAFESGPPCGCSARPLLKSLVQRKMEEIDSTIAGLQGLRAEMHDLHGRTVALEGKTPEDLLKSGTPRITDAMFARLSTPANRMSLPKN